VVEFRLTLLTEFEELRFVKDRVLITVAVCADSIAAVSLASSNVSYRSSYR
jgi:hypothetical protein